MRTRLPSRSQLMTLDAALEADGDDLEVLTVVDGEDHWVLIGDLTSPTQVGGATAVVVRERPTPGAPDGQGDRDELGRTPREREVVELTEAGHNQTEVGEMLGITKQRVNQLLQRAEKRARAAVTEGSM